MNASNDLNIIFTFFFQSGRSYVKGSKEVYIYKLHTRTQLNLALGLLAQNYKQSS